MLGDPHTFEPITAELKRLTANRFGPAGKPFRTIIYFPVDSRIFADQSSILKIADVPVTYTNWARDVVSQTLPQISARLRVIYHGSDPRSFYPLGPPNRTQLRRHFGISDPNGFLIVNVANNFARKDLTRCILAFAQFKKRVPDVMLYLHTDPYDQIYPLIRCVQMLGLSGNDVRFPDTLGPAGLPVEVLNQIYNAADVFFTTTLGEGWGLPISEAMAAGVPVVAPHNSSIPGLLGANGERGYLYPCPDLLWVDQMGFRPVGRVDDIVTRLMDCYQQRGSPAQRQIIERAQTFVRQHTWEQVCKQWVELFDEVARRP